MSETEDSEALSRGERSPKIVVSAPTSPSTSSGKGSAVVDPCALGAALPLDTPVSFQTCPSSLREFFYPPSSSVSSAPGQAPASSPGGAGSSPSSKPIPASVAGHQHVIKSYNGVPQGARSFLFLLEISLDYLYTLHRFMHQICVAMQL